MNSMLEATHHFLRRRARMSVLESVTRYWRFLNSDLIEEAYLVELIPEIEGVEVPVTADIRHPFELPYGERMVLASILKVLKPMQVFEFGTYSGSTTVLIADLLPAGGTVTTLDLPEKDIVSAGIDPEEIGRCFADNSSYDGRIQTIRDNSRTMDFSQFTGSMDLVFVDASHQYDDVIRDSHNALEMLSPNGIVLWDDYHPTCLPVAEALDDLSRDIPIRRIAQTRLALHGSRIG